jgi:adenosylhomocysteine nucleosidase
MEIVGLLAAMPQESNALLRYIKDRKRTLIGVFRGVRFRLMDRDCVLITTGMGIKRAMEGTRTLVATTNPHLLVSFGIAGAVNNDLNIGDVVNAESTYLMDNGVLGRGWALDSLSKAAWNAASQALQQNGAQLFAGTSITTRGSQVLLNTPEKLSHPILEMETAGIAQVSFEMGIPLVSIRSISDGPQAPIPFDLEALLDANDNIRIGKLLTMILRNRQIIFRSSQMLRNSKVASDHAAQALIAALSQPLL